MGGPNKVAHCSLCKGTRAMFQNFYDDTKHWMAQPYKENGTVIDWVLFFGLMVCASYLWARVIRAIIK